MDVSTVIDAIELTDAFVALVCGSHIVSEILPHTRKIQANSSLQLIFAGLKALARLFAKKERYVKL